MQYEGVLLAGYVAQIAGAAGNRVRHDRSIELPSWATEDNYRQGPQKITIVKGHRR